MLIWRIGACPLRRVWDAQLIRLNIRSLFSETGVWEQDYRAETRRRVEQWWHGRIQEQWQKDEVDQVSLTMYNPIEHICLHFSSNPEDFPEWLKSD